jgi:hypothetical protein
VAPNKPAIDIGSSDNDIASPPSKPAQKTDPAAKAATKPSVGDYAIRLHRLTANSSDEGDLDVPAASSAAAVLSNLPVGGGSSGDGLDLKPPPAVKPTAVTRRPLDLVGSDEENDLDLPPARPSRAAAVRRNAAGFVDDGLNRAPRLSERAKPGSEDGDSAGQRAVSLAKKFLEVAGSDDEEDGGEEDFGAMTPEELQAMLNDISLDGEEEEPAVD